MKAHGLNPRIRKSPFFNSSLKYGATEFHPYNGMWMPVGYDIPEGKRNITLTSLPFVNPDKKIPRAALRKN